MLVQLTQNQRNLIQAYIWQAREVYFHGIDQNDLPVISFEDADEAKKVAAFAVLKRPRSRTPTDGGHLRETTTTGPAYPLRGFSPEENDNILPEDHELLSRLTWLTRLTPKASG